ncbi:MAG: tripartite tricarboxylate transporter substrate-binding protein, partial [Pseudomonadota bacterium]
WGQGLVKPVKIIVPVQTGTGADLTARYYAEKLTQALGQAFIVDNRVGADGSIGMSAGAKADPDGYTLVQGALGQNILNQYLFASLPYDPEKDFDPIILASKIPFIISATPTFAANSITELIAAAKAKPGTITQ